MTFAAFFHAESSFAAPISSQLTRNVRDRLVSGADFFVLNIFPHSLLSFTRRFLLLCRETVRAATCTLFVNHPFLLRFRESHGAPS